MFNSSSSSTSTSITISTTTCATTIQQQINNTEPSLLLNDIFIPSEERCRDRFEMNYTNLLVVWKMSWRNKIVLHQSHAVKHADFDDLDRAITSLFGVLVMYTFLSFVVYPLFSFDTHFIFEYSNP